MSHTTSYSFPASAYALPSLMASLDALSTMNNAAYCRVRLSKSHKTSKCTFIPEGKRKAVVSFPDINFK